MYEYTPTSVTRPGWSRNDLCLLARGSFRAVTREKLRGRSAGCRSRPRFGVIAPAQDLFLAERYASANLGVKDSF
jgi:hypothetical protein